MPHFSPDSLVRRYINLPRVINDESAQHLLKVASTSDAKAKLASIGLKDLDCGSFNIRKGHAYLFLVSLGSGEFFGANENADYFPEKSGKVIVFPEPEDKDRPQITLGKGLEECHKTFKVHGAVYKGHKTEPEHGVKRSGDIVWERWNPRMHRGELIVELPESKWEDELALSEKGTPLMWSQGSGTPMDVCIRCGHIVTPKNTERCRHILLRKLCFERDGIQNVILCPDALFYDISYVKNNPADKIAAALLRIASPEQGPSLKETLRITGIVHYSSADVIRELSAAESDMSDEEARAIGACCCPPVDVDARFVQEAKKHDPEKVLVTLHRLKIVLTPTQFARIFCTSAEPTGVGGYLDSLPGIFGRLLNEEPGFTDDAGYFPSEPPDHTVLRALEPFSEDLGIRAAMRKPILIIKTSGSERIRRPTSQGLAMAGQYARYLHTCLTLFGGPSAARRCVGMMTAGL